ncbi:MAG: YCF48-related protein, partial [Ignavibacteria bacterium]
MKTKNLIAEKISSLIYAASILIFIIAFNFSDNPPSGWTQQFLPDLNNRPLSDIQFIDSLTGYGVTGDDTIGDTNYIIKTTNSGDNWFIINIIDKDLTDVDFININTGYVIGGLGTPGYLIKTTNGGENWIEIITPVASGFDDMFVYNEDTIWIASDNTFNGGLFKTTNGGVNWVLQYFSGANPPRNIYMVNSQLGFFSTNNQSSLFKTTNGGMNWILMANQNGFKDIYFTDSLTGWKSTGGIKKTTDGGLNWIEQVLPPKGGIISTSSIIKFSNINSDTIWGAGGQAFYGSGRRRGIIYRTTNGGNNWMIQIPDTSFHIEGFYSIQFLNKYTGWSF